MHAKESSLNIQMKECTFAPPRGKVQGYIVSEEYFELDSENIASSAAVRIGNTIIVNDLLLQQKICAWAFKYHRSTALASDIGIIIYGERRY